MSAAAASTKMWFGVAVAALAFALSLSAAAREAAPGLGEGQEAADRAALGQVCGRCHNVEIVLDTTKSAGEWRDTVQTMVDHGARGTDQQFEALMRYLRTNATTIDVNTADRVDLEAVLGVSPQVAEALVARRQARPFSSLADLETVPDVDARSLEAKRKLIFF